MLNRFGLDGVVIGIGDLRHTPAGVPAIECDIAHLSMQAEAGGERRVECDVHAVAFGDVAVALSRVAVGAALRCEGFVARRYRTGPGVALHLTRFEQN
ncbi:MAG: primosomal replication protein N [Betaproteobacteria bacterium]